MRLLTLKEAAERLNVPLDGIRKMVGKRRLRIQETALDRFVLSRTTPSIKD